MATHIALLRGINVGGKNRLPMKQLVEFFERSGAKNVGTYIQSGNVIFEASATLAKRVPALVGEAILETCGFEAPVITRSAGQLADVVEGNPYATGSADEKSLAVAFLASSPSAANLARLDPERSPPDEFVARGREIYLRFPNGVARSKLTNAYFDRTLKTTSTARNWNTTRKLLELAQLV